MVAGKGQRKKTMAGLGEVIAHFDGKDLANPIEEILFLILQN